MKLSSYVITHDYGFAPNPYGGVLTLATCKPTIRKSASVGNWIMGTASAASLGANRLIFVGEIAAVLPMQDYGDSKQYKDKIPTSRGNRWQLRGDNIYFKDNEGSWVQRKNSFHGQGEIEHDLSGKNVVACQRYWYFGNSAPEIPPEFMSVVKKGPGHKDNEGNPSVNGFLDWVQSFPEGESGEPSGIKAS